MMGYDPSVLQHLASVAQHSSQGNQRRRGSTVKAREVFAVERLCPQDVGNAQVTGDPIAELQNNFQQAISLSRSLTRRHLRCVQ
jgi:hypothetical protein